MERIISAELVEVEGIPGRLRSRENICKLYFESQTS